MADISDVGAATIKDLYERLESLSCMSPQDSESVCALTIDHSPNPDQNIILTVALSCVFRLSNDTLARPQTPMKGSLVSFFFFFLVLSRASFS